MPLKLRTICAGNRYIAAMTSAPTAIGTLALPLALSAYVLLVEDDTEISGMLADVLKENGFKTQTVTSAPEMDAALVKGDIDLVVLDIMLPGEDGLSICQRLRAESGIPIIMLTALKEDVDRIVGLEIGADDYITKPFNPRELVARIRALLRRSQSGPIVRSDRARALFNPEGATVSLTSAEFDVLIAFCRNPGKVLSREQLLEVTHGGLAGPIERSIDVHVSRIRQKIEPDPNDPTLIKTVRLGGYIFALTVEAA